MSSFKSKKESTSKSFSHSFANNYNKCFLALFIGWNLCWQSENRAEDLSCQVRSRVSVIMVVACTKVYSRSACWNEQVDNSHNYIALPAWPSRTKLSQLEPRADQLKSWAGKANTIHWIHSLECKWRTLSNKRTQWYSTSPPQGLNWPSSVEAVNGH